MAMSEGMKQYTVDVWMDHDTFRKFSIFNSITKDKRWLRPAVFAAVFCGLAAVCFIFREYAQQAVLMGAVLLAIGLGLPAVYFGVFFQTLGKRSRELKIRDQKKRAYCVTLTDEDMGIAAVTPKGEERRFRWKDALAAYRMPDAIYLYVEAGRVYILPDAYMAEKAEAIWELTMARMPKGRARVW